MRAPWDLLKLFADPTRLRIINLLLQEELSVAELQEILDMGQSRISSHLSLIRKNDIVIDRKEGKKTFYAISPDAYKNYHAIIQLVQDSMKEVPEGIEDLDNLKRIIEKRKQTTEIYFNSVAGRLNKSYCPGRSWEAIGHFLFQIVPRVVIADLGSGDGMISHLLAKQAEKVYCIDNSAKMVEVGSEIAEKNNLSNVHYKLGDMEDVPLASNSVDIAIMSQALHHTPHPSKAINEAYRILNPGGKLIVIDLLEHQFDKARELYADLWLGFTENKIHNLLKDNGFKQIQVGIVAKEVQEPHFETILGTGIK
jgi:ArsR family transcriptional regulator